MPQDKKASRNVRIACNVALAILIPLFIALIVIAFSGANVDPGGL